MASMGTTADQILFLLKTRGGMRTGDVAEELAVSRQGARQHLEKMASDGLVAQATQRLGVGRPGQLWALTDVGHERFPNSHAHVAVDLITAIRAELGDEAIERMIASREPAIKKAYLDRAAGATSTAERVASLAEARTAEGYVAEWREMDDGSYVLIENHCCIQAAARTCSAFCRSELAVIQSTLGPDVSVKRTEHILAGARRCAYHITLTDRALQAI
jgi:predicted ArsR family transcriptional regulator